MKKCIICLAQLSRKNELNGLIENLNDKFIQNNKNIDLLIFTEEKDKNIFEDLSEYKGGNIIQHIINNFNIPNSNFNREVPEYVFSFPISYRIMCQFFSGELFKILKNLNYDYYLRLDTDSRFLDTVPTIFDDFIKNDYYYGYITIMNEPPEVTTGMVDSIKKYIYKNNIKCNDFILLDHIDQLNFVYYNNFEVVKISEFTSDLHIKLYDYLNDDINGFLKYRWGDALFRFIYVNLFFDQNKIKYYNDVNYSHYGTFKNKPFSFNNFNLNEYRKNRLSQLSIC